MSDPLNQQMAPLQVRIMAVATASSSAVLALVLYLMHTTGAMPDTGFVGDEPVFPVNIAGPIAVGLGVVIVAGSFAVRRVLEANTFARDNSLMARTRVMIVAMALSESAAIIGMVLGFLTGDLQWPFTCMGIGFAGCILHFPTTAWLSQADDYPQE